MTFGSFGFPNLGTFNPFSILGTEEPVIEFPPVPSPAVVNIAAKAEEILAAQPEAIVPIINPLMAFIIHDEEGPAPDFSMMIALMKRLLESERHAVVFQAISTHNEFPTLLCTMLRLDPLLFAATISCLDNRKALCAQTVEREKQFGFVNFVRCFQILAQAADSKSASKQFEMVAWLFDEEDFNAIASIMVGTIAPEELGRIFALTEDARTADALISILISIFVGRAQYLQNLCQVINGIATAADQRDPKCKPSFLVQLLVYGEREKLHQTVMQNRQHLSPRALVYVLWCMPPNFLKGFVQSLNVYDNGGDLISWMDQLVVLEPTVDSRIKILNTFFKHYPEEEFNFFLSQMLILGSPSIPYLCPAMDKEQCQVFVLMFDPQVRTDLLRRGLTASVNLNREIAAKVNHQKKEMLCTQGRMDIVSKKLVTVVGEQFGEMLTLDEVSRYISEGMSRRILEDRMVEFEADYVRIPPFFFALAMKNDQYRLSFITTIRRMTDEQLTAFVQQLPHNREAAILDQLMEVCRQDQMINILEEIPLKTFLLYLGHRRVAMKAGYEDAQRNQRPLSEELEGLKRGNRTAKGYAKQVEKMEGFCNAQLGRLTALLNPLNLALARFAKEVFEQHEVEETQCLTEVINMITVLQSYQTALRGPEGFIRALVAIKSEIQPAAVIQTDFNIERIPAALRSQLSLTNESLHAVGLSYDHDYENLGINFKMKRDFKESDFSLLKRYLQQPNLREIWAFFRSKDLGTVSDLFSMVILQRSKELLELNALAKKMGMPQK